MTLLWLDLRYALRTMAKSPGLTAVLVITLALGIGATTTIFSVVNSVILRPLPYPEPERLARLSSEITGKADLPHVGFAVPEFRDLKRNCRTCAGAAAWRDETASLAGGDRPVRVQAIYASSELLPLIGVRPLLGRVFDASEDRPGDPQVVVLGYDLWQRVFGGDPGIVGKQVQLDAVPVAVIGVMPRGFRFPERAELWVPARLDYEKEDAGNFGLAVVVRLAPGASLAALEDDLAAQSRGWTDWINVIAAKAGFPPMVLRLILPLAQFPTVFEQPRGPSAMHGVLRTIDDPAELIPAVHRVVAEIDPTLPLYDVRTMDDVLWEAVARPRFLMFLLTSFAGIALLLAAVGIYGVMAHTVAQRTHEIGLRVALGARPAQVRAMVLRQAATLVAAGVAIGLAAAVVLSAALGAALRGLFYGEQLAQPVLLGGVALAVIATALLATWIPARRATEVQPTVALRSE